MFSLLWIWFLFAAWKRGYKVPFSPLQLVASGLLDCVLIALVLAALSG